MSYGIVLVFGDATEEQYWAVNKELGINPDGTGDWPDGLVAHTGGPIEGGGLVVVEQWTSKAAHEAFMAGRLGAALAAVSVPAPTSITEFDVVNTHHLG